MSPPKQKASNKPRRPPKPDDDSIKQTVESLIIALILAFTFRAYVVEAFVIPTGSMAPTLRGKHLRVQCIQCGYTFLTDVPEDSKSLTTSGNKVARPLIRPYKAICSMCRYPNKLDRGTRPASGDRILVHKYIYLFSKPRRWDIVVFKNPWKPDVNYIKRLIGLPREQIHLLDGNIYVKPMDQAGAAGRWQIARKTDPDANSHWKAIQRSVWQPIHYSQFIPLDGGRLAEKSTALKYGRGSNSWTCPWVPDQPESDWKLDSRSYRHASPDPGTIRFHFGHSGDDQIESIYPYNQHSPRRKGYKEHIEDVRIAATFVPDEKGLQVRLSTTARLDRTGPEILTATIEPDGRIVLTATDSAGQVRTLESEQVRPFARGRATQIELWYVDQEASVWINRKRSLDWRYWLSLEDLRKRPGPQWLPEISIEVSGTPVTVHRVELDRDLYYSDHSAANRLRPAKGALTRRGRPEDPVRLYDDEYFCIGDNGPRSLDSRYWDSVDPWILRRMFAEGRDEDDAKGVVPGKLLMGRAFFVYFPAPFQWWKDKMGVVPNFGDMRPIH